MHIIALGASGLDLIAPIGTPIDTLVVVGQEKNGKRSRPFTTPPSLENCDRVDCIDGRQMAPILAHLVRHLGHTPERKLLANNS